MTFLNQWVGGALRIPRYFKINYVGKFGEYMIHSYICGSPNNIPFVAMHN